MLYVNGAPIAASAEGTAFYRDFVPGQYVFSVENCLPQRGTSQTLNLRPARNSPYRSPRTRTAPGIARRRNFLPAAGPAANVPSLFAPLTLSGQTEPAGTKAVGHSAGRRPRHGVARS